MIAVAIAKIAILPFNIDCAGGAFALRELSRAPIVAHVGDLSHYRRVEPMSFRPTGWFGRIFRKAPMIHAPYQVFIPPVHKPARRKALPGEAGSRLARGLVETGPPQKSLDVNSSPALIRAKNCLAAGACWIMLILLELIRK